MSVDVCVVGSINLDIVTRVDGYPAPGETVFGRLVGRYAGGKGLNQAVAATRDGAVVRFHGAVGDDADGHWMRSAIRAAGLGDGDVATVDAPTGVAFITVSDAENQIIVCSGANEVLDPQAAASAVQGAKVVLVQLETPVSVVRAALEAARTAGAMTVLNAAPVAGMRADLLPLVDVLVVNEAEAAALGGADQLLRSGCAAVVTTLGPRGSEYRSGDDWFTVAAHEVEAIDSTGAGDAYCGVLAAGLARGLAIDQALRRASAAGAIIATVLGAQHESLTPEAIDELSA